MLQFYTKRHVRGDDKDKIIYVTHKLLFVSKKPEEKIIYVTHKLLFVSKKPEEKATVNIFGRTTCAEYNVVH